jgi:hypothetical protein
MGVGACNVLDRMAASLGDLTAVEPVFQAVSDVPHGGVLLAVPALLAVGLLHQTHKYFQLPKGYYGLESLFLLLAFLALARLPSLEQLRYRAPGEWGKLLGLDRIPEVRTVRQKIALLAAQQQASAWSAELCAHWMGEDPEQAAVLYVDGCLCGSTTVIKPPCRATMWRAKSCACAPPPITGSMPWMASPFFCSTRPSIPASCRYWNRRLCRAWKKTSPTSPRLKS